MICFPFLIGEIPTLSNEDIQEEKIIDEAINLLELSHPNSEDSADEDIDVRI